MRRTEPPRLDQAPQLAKMPEVARVLREARERYEAQEPRSYIRLGGTPDPEPIDPDLLETLCRIVDLRDKNIKSVEFIFLARRHMALAWLRLLTTEVTWAHNTATEVINDTDDYRPRASRFRTGHTSWDKETARLVQKITIAVLYETPAEALSEIKAFITFLDSYLVGDNNNQSYTDIAPSPEAAVPLQLRMTDHLDQAVKKARAAARLSAAYEVLVRESDLSNSALAEDVRRRRAERLLRTYERLRKVKPDFHDTSDQLTTARRIHMAAYRERERAKRGAGPAVRGRPRTRKLNV